MGLGRLSAIDLVQIWNRTDCCVDRLSRFLPVGVAGGHDGPVTGPVAGRPGGAPGAGGRLGGAAGLNLALGGASGRDVRIQLAGTNALSLAEVKVFGQ